MSRSIRSGRLRLAALGALIASLATGNAIARGNPAIELRSLSYSASGAADRFLLRSDAAISSYHPYQYSIGAGGRFVLEIPNAASALKRSTEIDGAIVSAVRVTSARDSASHAVRILFMLKGEFAYRLDIQGTSMVLEFTARSSGKTPPASEIATTRAMAPTDQRATPSRRSRTDEYRIGAGDTLDIEIFDHDDLSGTYRVNDNGGVSFPLTGRMQADGLTVQEFQESLRRRLDRDYLVDPQVRVKVSDYRSKAVDVAGAVKKPGRYYLEGITRLQDIISLAGGPLQEAGEEIILTRHGIGDGKVIKVERSELYSGSRPELNLPLMAGDVVELKPHADVAVMGEVTRPGSYQWKRDLTVLQAIALAGGPSVWAKDSAEILRGRSRIAVDLKAVRKGKKPDVKLMPGDRITVKRRIL